MAENVETLKKDSIAIVSQVSDCLEEMKRLHFVNDELHEQVLDLQVRSMKDNVLFNGIPETDDEDMENVLTDFLKNQMKIEKCMTFARVHRLGKRDTRTDRVRPIVAKFECFKDRETVRRSSRVLKDTHYGISEQFPPVIVERRKQLWPKFKEAKRRGVRASLVVDKLFIEGRRWYPDSERASSANKTRSPAVDNPSKRPRHHDQPPRESRDRHA
ncbi:uncharacterized protein LOC121374793 [Gigantopelta aegis]|uniref:uncharacterized protein LOC121374793 n=1 Tax=Gigantopelta aegis TaxID=1735272 RepID=UPI001B88CC1E|nr:uncharacterized protein LOC121374793 [Gigantopelta aegis]